jgi:hypothetical protein
MEKCKKLEETIQRVATNTIGYKRKQANYYYYIRLIAEELAEYLIASCKDSNPSSKAWIGQLSIIWSIV